MASNWISDIYWDERGRPYRVYLMDGPGYRKGERQYVPPVEARYSDDPKLRAWGEGNQAPGQSFLKERGTWDSDTGEWDQGTNWTNILSAGVGAGIAAPLLLPALGVGGGSGAAGSAGAGGAAGGSGAAGGAGATGATGAYLAPAAGGSGAATAAGAAAIPASTVPVAAAMQGPNTSAMASQGASQGVGSAPLGGVMPGASNLASAGGMGLKEMLEAAAKGAPLAAMALGGLGGGGNGGGSAQGMDELNRIARITEARMRRADPLHEAAVQLAFGGLPTYGRQGINLPKVPLP